MSLFVYDFPRFGINRKENTMAHPHHDDARQTHGDKLDAMTGRRGEYPPDRAARLVGTPGAKGQGDSCQPAPEVFAPAAARQVSNYGNIKGD